MPEMSIKQISNTNGFGYSTESYHHKGPTSTLLERNWDHICFVA